MMFYALVLLIAALIPAFIGLCAWRRGGKPGAKTLAALMWALALWSAAHAIDLSLSGPRGGAEDLLYLVEQTALLAAAPLWLIFTLQHTGRERWLTRLRLTVIAAIPAVTFALIVGGERYAPGLGTLAGLWLSFDLVYRTALLFMGTGLLVLMLVNSRRLYALQSLCLLAGFLAPWATIALQQFGLVRPALSLYLLPASLAVSGLSLTWALLRYRFLDLSPVAHDVLLEAMSDGMIALDLQSRIVDLSLSAERIIGCKASEVLGEDFRKVMVSRVGATVESNRQSSILKRHENHAEAHEEIRIGEGENVRHYDVAISPLYDSRGRKTGRLVVLHDTTERKRAVERLGRMARYDGLTGLPNRAYFHERLNEEIARARRRRGMFALLFIDLDGFKNVNDTMGHEAGDALLKETASRLTIAVRDYDVVCRLAGDEFTVILPEIMEAADATVVAERIVESFAEPFDLAGQKAWVTTSLGLCFFPTDGTDPATLIRNADAAMYQAKQAGKNQYVLFTRPTLVEPARHIELETELVRAIDNNELTLFYRPEIQISTSHMVSVEALLRWEHPERGLLHPGEFLPHVEEMDLILSIERWVLREACRQLHSWQQHYPTESPLAMSVNLSSRHFAHPDLAGEVSRILRESEVSPESLILEIPESAFADNIPSAAVTLKALRDLGVRLALDDFGVGSCSIAELTRCPPDVLKIDSSLIPSIRSETDDGKLVSAIITLAHALGIGVVAQGVEDSRQLIRLKKMGCDVAQGSYFAESLTRSQTSTFLASSLAGTPLL